VETRIIDEIGTVLDRWIAPELRLLLEQHYWSEVELRTSLDALALDENFRANPSGHIGLFSDHGVRHARDVALRTLELVTLLHGTTITTRSAQRLEFIQGCAVVLSYLHDVGMSAPVARKFHAQYASQLVFDPVFDPVLSQLLDTNAGGLMRTISEVDGKASFGIPLRQVAQEVLATAVCHSKSCVPAAVISDRALLREALLKSATQDLSSQAFDPAHSTNETEMIDSSSAARFAWIVSHNPEIQAFADDVIDAARVVRMADAMRQRGTTLRTSAGNELLVDSRTGSATAVLRSNDRTSAFLTRFDCPVSVGEANLQVATLRNSKALRFAFHRGYFDTPEIEDQVAAACVVAMDDIQRDVLEIMFDDTIRIEIVEPGDNPDFALRVQAHLVRQSPYLEPRIDVVAANVDVGNTPSFDWRNRGKPFDASLLPEAKTELQRAGLHPHHSEHPEFFTGVLHVRVARGEAVITAHESPEYVVVALGHGLLAEPLGGYATEPIQPWVPIGIIGVLRGDDRNATVRCLEDLDVLVIPRDHFLTYWAQPFEIDDLCQHFINRPEVPLNRKEVPGQVLVSVSPQ
jgi:hypothetical protein